MIVNRWAGIVSKTEEDLHPGESDAQPEAAQLAVQFSAVLSSPWHLDHRVQGLPHEALPDIRASTT
jgi:hypothetical protein